MHGISKTDRIINRRNGALTDLELVGVELTAEQSVALDSILDYQPLSCSSTIGSLVLLGPDDRAAVCDLMKLLPWTNTVINYRKGNLR